jgi:hypothetical protein
MRILADAAVFDSRLFGNLTHEGVDQKRNVLAPFAQ